MSFNLVINSWSVNEYEEILGNLSIHMNQKKILSVNTDIEFLIDQFYQCYIALIEEKDFLLSLQNCEVVLEIQRVDQFIRIKKGRKDLAKVPIKDFLTGLLSFLKKATQGFLDQAGLLPYSLRIVSKNIGVIEPYHSNLCQRLVDCAPYYSNPIFTEFESTTKHILKWSALGNFFNRSSYVSMSKKFMIRSIFGEEMFALDLQTKRLKWSQKLVDDYMPNAFLETDQSIIVWNDAHEDDIDDVKMIAYNIETGSVLWKKDWSKRVLNAQLLSDNKLTILLEDSFSCIDITTGKLVGNTSIDIKPSEIYYDLDANYVIMAGSPIDDEYELYLQAIDLYSSKVLWTKNIPFCPNAPSSINKHGFFNVTEDRIQCWSFNKNCCTLQLEEPLLHQEEPLFIDFFESALLLCSIDYNFEGSQTIVRIFDRTTLKERKHFVLKGQQEIPSTLMNEKIIVPLEKGQIYLIDLKKEELSKRFELIDEIEEKPLVCNDFVFVSAKSGHLKAIHMTSEQVEMDVKLPRELFGTGSIQSVCHSELEGYYFVSADGSIFNIA